MAPVKRPAQPRPLRSPPKLHVLIAGASGFIGSELVRQLEEEGHRVLRLVRRKPHARNEFGWSPVKGAIDPGVIDSVDAVVNLAGSPNTRLPWTPAYQRRIRESRLAATSVLADAIASARNVPFAFLSASGTSYYGDKPGMRLTEQSPKGDGFLSDLVVDWEAAANNARGATRVVNLRTGFVVGRGGAFTPLIPLTRFGLAARMGTGGQHWPWISVYDEAAAIRHLLSSSLEGPVNLAGPKPATADRITRSLAKSMHRWHPLIVPESAIRLGLGAGGRELLLPSQKVVPERLLADGFEFRHKCVEDAIEDLIVRK